MYKRQDIQSARFVPAAETVVEKNSIRLDGTLSAEPDQFRRLVLLLSEQPWLSGMEFLNVTPTGGAPSYALGTVSYTHLVSNPVCYPRFRTSASVTVQVAAFATGVPPDIYGFHSYTWNSATLSGTQAWQYQRQFHSWAVGFHL